MLEEIVYYEPRKTKYGIISYPFTRGKDLPLVIFLNAGLINRQGPNRIYVNICRSLSAVGFTCFRFDLPGIGDNVNKSRLSTKSEMYKDELKTIINYFKQTNKFNSFILCGLCTGANLAYDYALNEDNISGVCMINGTRIVHSNQHNSRINSRYYKKYFTDFRRWKKFLAPKKILTIPKYFSVVTMLTYQKVRGLFYTKKIKNVSTKVSPEKLEAIENWKRLIVRDVEVLQVVAEGSETFDDLNNLDNELLMLYNTNASYRTHIIYNADHTFTSIISQRDLIGEVVKWCQSRFIKKQLPV